jgi:hypothetical protein
MAEEFPISIPVDLGLDKARAELRRFTEEAARGVSVPVGGMTSAESAAVNRAHERVIAASGSMPRTPRGRGASLARSNIAAMEPDWLPGLRQDLFGESNAMLEQLPASGGRVPAQRAQARARRASPMSSILGTGSYRGLLGLLGVTEVANAAQAIREGDAAASLAGTPEEAMLARAQGIERGTSGLLGSAMAFAPNLLDMQGSPQRMMREAQTAVALRQQRDQIRAQEFSNAGDAAFRQGFVQGGTPLAEISRSRIKTQEAMQQTQRRIAESEAALGETRIVSQFWSAAAGLGEAPEVRENVLQGEARSTRRVQLATDRETLRNIQGEQQFIEERYGRDAARSRRANDNETYRYGLIRGGIGTRQLARRDIETRCAEQLDADQAQFGAFEGARRNRQGLEAALGAFDASNDRQDRQERSETGAGNILDFTVTNLVRAGDNRAAGIARIRGSRDAEIRARETQRRREGASLGFGELATRAGIFARSAAEEAEFTDEFDRSQKRADRQLELRENFTGLQAKGQDKSAVAQQITGEALIAADEFRGPDAGKRRRSVIQTAINQQETFLRTLQLQGLQGGGQQVAPGTVGPGVASSRPNEQNLVDAIKAVQNEIKNLKTALTGGEG